ncbi:unnamed protein product [Arabis nemorensis]|uniref:phosphoribosylformylglycinamidine cyclo-ligase n=1 Tax=Arabis nemorensis TaxID=586526 RepID=A0A565BWM4_9BRAS|nr:unnamed protein product [Arabis nemorensis]
MESRIMESSFCSSVSSGSINRYRFSSGAKPFSICFPQKTRTMSLKASENDEGFTYKDSGVDIDAGTELTRRIRKMVPGIGGFSGGYEIVFGMDGVGTKLKLAFETGKHDTVGIDLIAMCVNDVITCGATPIGFVDYYLRNHAVTVITGIFYGCQQSSYDPMDPCNLLGGELEMGDFYAKGHYELVGCAVGKVKKDSIIDGKNIVAGDVLIGLHSFQWLLLSKKVLGMVEKGGVKGLAHITGGGMTDNIPRILPHGLGVVIHTNAWELPPLFTFIQKHGNVEDGEMRRTFNMGIGMVMVVSPDAALRILGDAENGDYVAYRIGEVVTGEGVTYH